MEKISIGKRVLCLAGLAGASMPYDCHSGLQNSWPELKAEWCCQQESIGCFDCGTNLDEWPKEQQDWCCKTARIGCPEPFDCFEGLESAWTELKQEWCCENHNRGCKVSAVEPQFDCFDGLEAEWTEQKEESCCQLHGKGCPTTTAGWDCNLGVVEDWPELKREYCCDSGQVIQIVGCAPTTTLVMFNCEEGSRATWPLDKIEYCCDSIRGSSILGCEITTTLQTINCQEGSRATWPLDKIEYCCEEMPGVSGDIPPGCVTTSIGGQELENERNQVRANIQAAMLTTVLPILTTVREAFTCEDEAELENTWSTEKKAWCCEKESKGCEQPGEGCGTYTCEQIGWVKKPGSENMKPASDEMCCEAPPIPATTEPPTTTPATCGTYSCTTENWVKKPIPETTAPADEATCCEAEKIAEIQCVNKNCYGEFARPVTCPGATGVGDDLASPASTIEECDQLCKETPDCEGVVFGNSRCHCKADVDVSKCQTQEGYEFRGNGFSLCALLGDPHVLPFDEPFGNLDNGQPTVNRYTPGVHTIVKSPTLDIQARYGFTQRFPTASSTVGIAVGGSRIKDHVLVLTYKGPSENFDGFYASWDDEPILTTFPSSFISPDGMLHAEVGNMNAREIHVDAVHTIGDTAADALPSYMFKFEPADLEIYVLIGPDNINAVIKSVKLPGTMEGYCGNFNCDHTDDTLEDVDGSGDLHKIPEEESLFKAAPTLPEQVEKAGPGTAPASLEDCDAVVKAAAEEKCAHHMDADLIEDCVFDACVAGSADAVEEDVSTNEVMEDITHGGVAMSPAIGTGGSPAEGAIAKKYRSEVSGDKALVDRFLSSAGWLTFGAAVFAAAAVASGVAGRRFRFPVGREVLPIQTPRSARDYEFYPSPTDEAVEPRWRGAQYAKLDGVDAAPEEDFFNGDRETCPEEAAYSCREESEAPLLSNL